MVPRLVMSGVCKLFPGVAALSDVGLTVKAGETLGLIGENGAGKSTLMNVLSGVMRPDAGEVRVDGSLLRAGSVRDALEAGIAVIHQELNLAPNLDVASNVLLGREPAAALGVLRRSRIRQEAGVYADMVGLTASLTALVEELSASQRQLVEIAKALAVSARILVLDEPTTSLSDHESEALFSVLERLRGQNTSLIYVSHRLHEIERQCRRVVVLRDGRNVAELDGAEINRTAMIEAMTGREVSASGHRPAGHTDRGVVLQVSGLQVRGLAGSFDFEVRAGEVLGIGGLVGSGRTELVSTLFGMPPPLAGRIHIDGKATRIRGPMDAVRAGLGLVPEDRKELGLLLEMSVRENLTLPTLRTTPGILVSLRDEGRLARQLIERVGVRTTGLEQPVQNLSGGNQQKVVLGKWLSLRPKVLILDEPTRGVDVAAKGEIHRLIRELADDGAAVLVVSSEMEEMLALADRVLVLREGRSAGCLDGVGLTEHAVLDLAMGGSSA